LIHHPPKPRFALTLGVTGHRLRRNGSSGEGSETGERVFDVEAVRIALGAFFRAATAAFAAASEEMSQFHDAAEPAFTLISSLAEGADRIAAQAALAAGFALDVVLPCPASIYVATFSDDASRAAFDALMDRARARLVLPLAGKPEKSVEDRLPHSYETAGLTMLTRSDILVAIWDGKPADGRGGTGQIVDEAVRRGIPVVVFDPASGATQMLWPNSPADPASARHAEDIASRAVDSCLGAILRRILSPPAELREQNGLTEYFACSVGSGARASLVFDGKDIGRTRALWPRVSAAVGATTANIAAARRYSAAMQAAEDVAGRSANRYRLLFLGSSVASVVASFFVAGAARFHQAHPLTAAIELLTVALVAGLAYFATLRRWHNQWFEAREAVERLRVVALPWVLGAWPAGLGPGQTSWPGWYARAVMREQPLFSSDLSDLLEEARDILRALVEEQSAYHLASAMRLERRDHFLEMVGLSLLAISIGDNALYLLARLVDWSSLADFESWSLAASIFLPAAATATYGIRLFGDFEDLARRSRRTASLLETLEGRLVGDLDLPALRALAGQAATAMLSDLDAWRVAVESRRLSAS
jgi:uncharacterized protein DUF4231